MTNEVLFYKLRRLLTFLYAKLLGFLDRITGTVVDVSIGDIMLMRHSIDDLQFLTASRLIDVENYSKGDLNFVFQSSISAAFGVPKQKIEKDKSKFENLIKRLQEGFDPKFPLLLDRNIRIMNGTHRVSLCLYYKFYKVSALISKRESKSCTSPVIYYSKPLSTEMLSKIIDRYNRIQDELIDSGICYSCLVEGNPSCFQHIVKDIASFFNVKRYDERDRKMLIRFLITEPDFILDNCKIVSKGCSRIQAILSHRYPNAKIVISGNCIEGKDLFDSFFYEVS